MLKLNTQAVSYHCYIDFGKETEQLKLHSNNIHKFRSYGKEVWITEFNMNFNNPQRNYQNYLSQKHLDMLHIQMPSMFKVNGCSFISRHSLWGNSEVSPFFPHIFIDNKNNSFEVKDKY